MKAIFVAMVLLAGAAQVFAQLPSWLEIPGANAVVQERHGRVEARFALATGLGEGVKYYRDLLSARGYELEPVGGTGKARRVAGTKGPSKVEVILQEGEGRLDVTVFAPASGKGGVWPEMIPRYPGGRVEGVAPGKGFWTMVTRDSKTKVVDWYERALEAAGYQLLEEFRGPGHGAIPDRIRALAPSGRERIELVFRAVMPRLDQAPTEDRTLVEASVSGK